MSDSAAITRLANRWAAFRDRDRKTTGEDEGVASPAGDPGDSLFEVVYDRLHAIASAQVARHRHDAVVQTTVVLNEAFLKLSRTPGQSWRDREHFFSYCARVMRHVLVDLAKARQAAKRGSGAAHLTLESAPDAGEESPTEEILTIHHALRALEKIDQERAQIVELRFFGGMEPREIGRALAISESTVHRRWRAARAWLYSHLRAEGGQERL